MAEVSSSAARLWSVTLGVSFDYLILIASYHSKDCSPAGLARLPWNQTLSGVSICY